MILNWFRRLCGVTPRKIVFKNKEFKKYLADVASCSTFRTTHQYVQHGNTSVLLHSIAVAYYSYYLSWYFHLNLSLIHIFPLFYTILDNLYQLFLYCFSVFSGETVFFYSFLYKGINCPKLYTYWSILSHRKRFCNLKSKRRKPLVNNRFKANCRFFAHFCSKKAAVSNWSIGLIGLYKSLLTLNLPAIGILKAPPKVYPWWRACLNDRSSHTE